MPRLRPAHVPLVLGAIARALVGTRTGRKVLLVGFGLGAGAWALSHVASGTGDSEPANRRDGTWSGLHNEYAPNNGDFVLEGEPGRAATCKVRGRAGSASGNGWVFKGAASVAEVACEGKVGKDGRVSARLKLERKWNGRVKGVGGDWDETRGSALCEGALDGTLSAGGTWEARCKTDEGKTYATSITWTLRAP